jgi:hypothetical protein
VPWKNPNCLKNMPLITRVPQPPSLESKSRDLEKDAKERGMHCRIFCEFELMVKIEKLV